MVFISDRRPEIVNNLKTRQLISVFDCDRFIYNLSVFAPVDCISVSDFSISG